MKVVLKEDAEFLDEVVVVGFGSQKKENLTGAVASVNVGKALESRPIADVGRGLQGSTPGLTIQVGSSDVGADPKIRIRGQYGSMEGSSAPLILLDNVEIPSISIVNPDDIESISVLKDAASASIYGAKAAFGVILITSKKGAGESEKITVNYSSNIAFQSMAHQYKLGGVDALHYTVEAAEREKRYTPTGAFWLIDRNGYNAAVAWEEKYGNGKLDPYAPMTYGRDWYVIDGTKKIGVRTYDPYLYLVKDFAPINTQNISIAGNKGKTNFNISLGYLDQDGMAKCTDYDYYNRYNVNARINTQIKDWLNVHAGLMFTRSTKSWAFSSNSSNDLWLYVFRWGPTYPQVTKDEYGNDVRSAEFEFANGNQATKVTTYTSVNTGVTFTPLKDWNINFDYTFAYSDAQVRKPGTTFTAGNSWGTPIPVTDAAGSIATVDNEWNEFNKQGSTIDAMQLNPSTYTSSFNMIRQESDVTERHTWNITSTYDLNLNDAHLFNFMVGFQAVGYEYSRFWGQAMDLFDIHRPEFDLATGTQTASGSHSWSSTAGVFGRVNYNYKEKYLLEGNLRYDGTSKFPTHLKWQWFPSVSAGWRVTQEPWMQGVTDVLSSLKLRASWGSIGDQSVSSSLYIPTIGSATTDWQHGGKDAAYGTPGLVISDLSWQRIETIDVGVDLSLFHQFNASFDWFRRTTKDMIVPMEGIGYNVGTGAPKGNFGYLHTDGWEFSLNWGKSFSNGLNLNLTANLADAVTIIDKYGSTKSINSWYAGKTYGEIWGYRVDRLFQNDDFAWVNGELVSGTDAHGKIYKFADGKDYATQGKITSGNLISGPGDVKFKDLNGDGVINNGSQLIDDHGDLEIIGNSTPRYEYSFRVDADWKGFDLSVFLQGIGKRDLWGNGALAIAGYHSSDGAMPQTIAGDFWYETKDNHGNVIDANYDAFYPRAAALGGSNEKFNMVKNDKYLLDMSYLRVKNITLGYSLPSKLIKKINLT